MTTRRRFLCCAAAGALPLARLARAQTSVKVHRIGYLNLRAGPGDLAIEQPGKLELVFNLKTAKGLGLSILPPTLLRADDVIR